MNRTLKEIRTSKIQKANGLKKAEQKLAKTDAEVEGAEKLNEQTIEPSRLRMKRAHLSFTALTFTGPSGPLCSPWLVSSDVTTPQEERW